MFFQSQTFPTEKKIKKKQNFEKPSGWKKPDFQIWFQTYQIGNPAWDHYC